MFVPRAIAVKNPGVQQSVVARPDVGKMQQDNKAIPTTDPIKQIEKMEIVTLENATLNNMQIHGLYKSLNIVLQGRDISAPIVKFAQCSLPRQVHDNLAAAGFESPTPIQMQVIPDAMNGRDVLACAETGSGKTAAFLLPMILHIARNR